MVHSSEQISLRRALMLDIGSYNDKNDGFLRSHCSRSKRNHSRNIKENKVVREKPIHKQ